MDLSAKPCRVCSIKKNIVEFINNRNICKICNNKQRKKKRLYLNKTMSQSTEVKKCSVCNETKQIKLFNIHSSLCKLCYNHKKVMRVAIEQKRETELTHKTCKDCGIEKCIDLFRAGENTCSECAKQKTYKWRDNNKEQFLDICKKYRKKPSSMQKRNEYCRQKYKNDEQYRLSIAYRRQIREVITLNRDLTHISRALLGCTVECFKNWLEFNFIEDMKWNNYGMYWTMDHIIPVSSFNLSDFDEACKCFNWENVAPIKKRNNNTKFNNIDSQIMMYFKMRHDIYCKINGIINSP